MFVSLQSVNFASELRQQQWPFGWKKKQQKTPSEMKHSGRKWWTTCKLSISKLPMIYLSTTYQPQIYTKIIYSKLNYQFHPWGRLCLPDLHRKTRFWCARLRVEGKNDGSKGATWILEYWDCLICFERNIHLVYILYYISLYWYHHYCHWIKPWSSH